MMIFQIMRGLLKYVEVTHGMRYVTMVVVTQLELFVRLLDTLDYHVSHDLLVCFNYTISLFSKDLRYNGGFYYGYTYYTDHYYYHCYNWHTDISQCHTHSYSCGGYYNNMGVKCLDKKTESMRWN